MGRWLTFLASAALASTNASALEITTVRTVDEIPNQPPDAGHYRLHLIDVGTGLSILIQGNTWNLLYDAGSNDDSAGQGFCAHSRHQRSATAQTIGANLT